MAKFAAVALLALLAVAFVAQADAAYGHISCYTAPGACAVKSNILTRCAAKTVGRTPVASSATMYPVLGCACFYYYAFADKATHDAYQTCEKTGAGKTLYGTIKSKDLPEGVAKEMTVM